MTRASLPEELAETWDRRPQEARRGSVRTRAPEIPRDGDVMLVGYAADEHLDAVQRRLTDRGCRVARVDADRWPLPGWQAQRPPEDAWTYRGVLCRGVDGDRPVAHHAERCIRTSPAADGPAARVRGFAVAQARMALLGMLDAVDALIWMNDPWAAARAEVKATQLRAAVRAGLQVPRTLISDDATTIRAFADEVGCAVVCKSLGDPLVWESGHSAGFLYTSQVTEDALADLEGRRPVPAIYQERLIPVAEYRITVVGDQVFPARVRVDLDAVDWRRRLVDGVAFDAVSLAPELEAAVRDTVAGLGLRYGAVDLLETADAVWFLEVNPSGAYGWLERRLDLPITDAICDQLLADGA